MSKIIILGTSGNYAASTTSSTANTATTPSTLLEGTIGIYGLAGLDATTSANTDKFLLITSATSAAGKIADSDFVSGGGQMLRLVQGTTVDAGAIAVDVNRLGIKSIFKKAYTAPIHQTTYIGYDGSTGKLNLPTFATGDNATVISVENLVSTGDKIRNQETYDAGTILSSTSTYSVLAAIAQDCNTQEEGAKSSTCFITRNGSVAAMTATGTAIKFTKGSTTAEYYIAGAGGLAASTGNIAASDVINIPSSNYRSFSFTAVALGTGAGRTLIALGDTIYNVIDGGSAQDNSDDIVTAINAGTQAKATNVGGTSTTVTITLLGDNYMARPLVLTSPDDAAWTQTALTIIDGETLPVTYKAAALVTGAPSFELDYEYEGETGYFYIGTTAASNTGIVTSITEYGLKFVVDDSGKVYGYAVQGVLENATISVGVGSSVGYGTYEEVSAIEKADLAFRGQFDTVDRRAKYIPTFATEGTLYDTYAITYTAPNETPTQVTNTNISNNNLIAIPSGHSAQSEFETIIKVLAISAVVNF